MTAHTTDRASRMAFTLIELLVVMALVAGLAAMTMLVAPKVLERDRSVDAVTKLTNSLQISRAMALRDGRPHGIRLIIDTTKPNPLHVTEFQFIEAPPVYVPNPLGPGDPTKFVEFRYRTDASGAISGTQQPLRECVLVAPAAELPAIVTQITPTANPGDTFLSLPTLGTFHRVDGVSGDPNSGSVVLTLDQYPDAQLGAAGPIQNGQMGPVFRTYHFGFYTRPRPVLGQPTEQLPVDTCVDLTPGVSEPNGAALVGRDYDILFGPGGQLVNSFATQGAGHVFLWVRDPGKANVAPVVSGSSYQFDPAVFPQAGEMMIIAIKGKSGGIGVGPVNWPDGPGLLSLTAPGGAYDPYLNARKAVGGQ